MALFNIKARSSGAILELLVGHALGANPFAR